MMRVVSENQHGGFLHPRFWTVTFSLTTIVLIVAVLSHVKATARDAQIIELGSTNGERSVLSSNVRVPAIRGRVPIKLEVMVDVSPDFS